MTHMALHHQQGVELAAIAEERASDPEVRSIAERIVDAQGGELDYLLGWLDRQGISLSEHDHELAAMPGVLSATTLERARTASGREFDELFLDAMSTHHDGAIQMAQDRLREDGDGAVTRFAQGVIEGQSVEVERMQAALERLRSAR